MAFKSFPQGAFPDCFAQKTLLPSFQEAPDLPPNISLYTHTHTHTHTPQHGTELGTVGLQEDLLADTLTVDSWF